MRDFHVLGDLVTARGCQTLLPAGVEPRFALVTPRGGGGGMPQQPGKPPAHARRISSRVLRPPRPPPVDHHNALQADMLRVAWAPPTEQLKVR